MNEKEIVLKMISEGKISVEDGEKLLRAMGNNREDKSENSSKQESEKKITSVVIKNESENKKSSSGKLVILVESTSGENVKLNIPLKMAGIAAKMMPQAAFNKLRNDGIDILEIINNINEFIENVNEDIVNVESSNGDKIRIYIDK